MIAKALSKRPEARYGSCSELMDALASSFLPTVRQRAEPVDRAARKQVVLAVAIVAMTVATGAVVALASVLFGGDPNSSHTPGAPSTPTAAAIIGPDATPSARIGTTITPEAATGRPAPSASTVTVSPTAVPATAIPPPAVAGPVHPESAAVDCATRTFDGVPYTGNMAQIAALDERTIRFSFCMPEEDFLLKVSNPAFAIQDAGHLELAVTDNTVDFSANGTGPFTLSEWAAGDSIVLLANPSYWADQPLSSTLTFRWEANPNQRLLELQAGAVDLISTEEPPGIAGLDPPVTAWASVTSVAGVDPGPDGELIYLADHEPPSLYCATAAWSTDLALTADGLATLRICGQIFEGLYSLPLGATSPVPALAEECTSNPIATEWTCSLRSGVEFPNGFLLGADDVVTSFAVQWDTGHPLYVPVEGGVPSFEVYWGGLLDR